ncbi:MAG: glycosyltransferase [Candidatus Hodarchaeota archaeon]
MSKKRILIINPGPLFPKIMASQDRIINMIKCLFKTHEVDVITLYKTSEEKLLSEKGLTGICNKYYLLQKPNHNFYSKKILGLIIKLWSYITLIPFEMVYPNWPRIKRKIRNIINNNNYDIVQIEYWYQCSIFKKIPDNILKVIDTHDVLYEKKELEIKHKTQNQFSWYHKRSLKKYRELELYNTGLSDVIISISKPDQKKFNKLFPNKKHLLISTGQNIKYFSNYPINKAEKTILFYGSLGYGQNIPAFWRFWKDILPLIKEELPFVKIVILGANPPREIRNLHNGKEIIVTGYVKDVRPYIAKSTICIIPLSQGSGFRGRVVEVMAMGVPVIGTHNALDSIDMKNGVHGYITDSNHKMAKLGIELLTDSKKIKEISENCRNFVADMYSVEATYGRLSDYLNK